MATNSKFWRVRMRYTPQKGDNDFSEKAWERGQVGIWYGAWSADDYYKAQTPKQEYLNSKVPAHHGLIQKLGTKVALGRNEINTIERFIRMPQSDWVVACFQNAIHLARLLPGPLQCDESSDLNRPHPEAPEIQELWKYRLISADRLRFDLSKLPDFYSLIPQAGRSNVFVLDTYQTALQILANARTEEGVRTTFEAMDQEQRLDFLGPKEWESFCLGYLIIKEQFVPTGLVVGGTLKALDIVGRNRDTHDHILAQCKKNDGPIEVEEEFRKLSEGIKTHAQVFYFAYGGCKDHPSQIKVIDKSYVLKWVEGTEGRKYLDSFFIKEFSGTTNPLQDDRHE